MKDERYGKWSPSNKNWQDIDFASVNYVFSDVQPSHPFSGATNVWYYNQVHSLHNAGITSGYLDGTYRPNTSVTRAEMAIFLLKAINGLGYEPPPADSTFSYTAVHWAAANWIEALRASGLTGGYPDGK